MCTHAVDLTLTAIFLGWKPYLKTVSEASSNWCRFLWYLRVAMAQPCSHSLLQFKSLGSQ